MFQKNMITNRVTPKRAIALTTISALALLISGLATSSERNTTNYDRQMKSQPGQQDIWSRVNIGSNPASVNGRELERGTQEVDGAALRNSWERMTQSADFTDLRDRVDNHEIRITDLEDRVTNLEDQPGNWQPGSPEAGGWQPVGSPGISVWSPEISNQEADFTQSRTVSQDVQRTVNVYETNAVTGERRLVDTYTETDTQTSTETRLIDVANNPGGGTDGWSAWQNVGSPNCSSATWSPATSTVNQGQTFTQTRNCTQTQRSFIYYLADGELLETRSRDIGVNAPQSRLAVGTLPVAQCRNTILEQGGVNHGWQTFSNGQTALWWGWDATGVSTNPTRFVALGVGSPTEASPYIRDGFRYWRTSSFITDPRIGGTNNRQYEVCRSPQ